MDLCVHCRSEMAMREPSTYLLIFNFHPVVSDHKPQSSLCWNDPQKTWWKDEAISTIDPQVIPICDYTNVLFIPISTIEHSPTQTLVGMGRSSGKPADRLLAAPIQGRNHTLKKWFGFAREL